MSYRYVIKRKIIINCTLSYLYFRYKSGMEAVGVHLDASAQLRLGQGKMCLQLMHVTEFHILTFLSAMKNH